MSFIFNLPSELLEGILTCCDPLEVAQVAQTCRHFRRLIYQTSDDGLWRNLYLSLTEFFDDPRECVAPDGGPRPPIKWRLELQRIIRARTLISTHTIGRPGELVTVLQTLMDLTSYVPLLSRTAVSTSISRVLVWLPAHLCRGWIDLVEQQPLATHERQMISRFHTSFGVTQNDIRPEALVSSRGFVYNMQNYSADNFYGPFTKEGRVDWVHVQAIHHVVSMQTIFEDPAQQPIDPETYEFAFYPMSLPFTQITEPAHDTSGFMDWAGLEGDWLVSFCFCDHRELLKYNRGITEPGIPDDTSILEDDDFQEVFRCMKVKIQVVKTEPNPNRPDKPDIFFSGVMREFNASIMRGRVWMAADGFVRWNFVSGEQQNAIWSSMGVQIGGLRSSYGVLGSWTTIFHESDDPVGPFWLRKCQPDT